LAEVQTMDKRVVYIDRSGKYIWGPMSPYQLIGAR
jgi:hypothetical protein